jgi:Uma2 family endonuclease
MTGSKLRVWRGIMATESLAQPITIEEFLRLEEEAGAEVTLELIEGEIQEKAVTTRGPKHSVAFVRTAQVLANWLDQHAVGCVAGEEVRCRLLAEPATIVGIDVGIWLGEQFVEPPTDPPLFDQPPVVAIEILSSSDRHEEIIQKIRLYQKARVPQVWIVDPDLQTVTAHRLDQSPRMFSVDETLSGEPELPGFETSVSALFAF